MLKSENIKSFLCFSFLAKKKKSDLFISASYCLEKSPRWSTRPHLRTEVRKEARKGSESFSPPKKKKGASENIWLFNLSRFRLRVWDDERRQTDREEMSRSSVCVSVSVCVGVPSSQVAPSDLGSKAAGKRLKALWVQGRDGGKRLEREWREKEGKNRKMQRRFPGADKSLQAQMDTWVQRPGLDQFVSLSYFRLDPTFGGATIVLWQFNKFTMTFTWDRSRCSRNPRNVGRFL